MNAVQGPAVLVLCPTRELAQQVTDEAINLVKHVRGVRIATVVGGMPFGKQIAGLRGASVVIATPGRLLDLYRRRQLRLDQVSRMVVDEADRMLDLGFSEDLEEIHRLCIQRQQTLMYSATFAPRIMQLAARVMREPGRIELATAQDRHADISQTLHWADGLAHKKKILDHLLRDTALEQAVVFASTQADTEIIAIDTAAPSLRYGHARAQSLGAKNIKFIQLNAEDLSRYDDGHFDWVQTTMFLHETSGKALPRIIEEGYRVLAKGGLMLHLEQPQYSDEMPLYEQFIRDWDAFNNNEPFWSAMHALDLKGIMQKSGFAKDELFVTGVRAVVDRSIFPEAPTGEAEDHGRAAVWNAYGAWKGGKPA